MLTHIADVLLKTHVGAAVTALPQVRLGGLGDRVRGAMFASMVAGLKHTDIPVLKRLRTSFRQHSVLATV